MNAYDFDKTVFYPDSMMQFVRFCLRRHPKLLVSYLPGLLRSLVRYAVGKEPVVKLHAKLNGIVKYLKDPDRDVADYWAKYEKNLSTWYLAQKRSDDLIISASPEYLLRPLTDKLGVRLIGTIVDRETGVMIGNVRLAKEKAKYIIEQEMPVIDNFYSDSLSDTPIALLADHAFLVKDKARRPEPWPHLSEAVRKKVHRKIDI